MEQSNLRSKRQLILKELYHKKIRSFQLANTLLEKQPNKRKRDTLKNSESSVDLRNDRNILGLNTAQGFFTRLYHKKDSIKKVVIKASDKQNKHAFFSKVYSHKTSKLITSNTLQQRERYLRKLNQAVNEDAFKAVGYEFDQSYVKYINDFLLTSNITKIILDNNPLGDSGIIKLTAVFPKIQLKELSLVSVNMGNHGASSLLKSLKEVGSLLKLNISTSENTNKNRIGSQGLEPLKQLLNSPSCLLQSLHLDHLRFGSEGARVALEGVTTTTLQHLSLSKNDIGVRYITLMGQSFGRIPLIHLNLSKNNLQDTGMKCLSDILGFYYNKNNISLSLTYLNLSNNSITSFGFEHYCKNMIGNRTLQTLILDQNPLGEGQRFFNIKYYLNKNWGIKKLSLCNISPGSKDLKFICQGLEGNRSVEELSLQKNEVDQEILGFIFVMLTKNKSLRRLNINNCKISDNCLVKNQYLISNCFNAIEEIDLQNNYINIKGANILHRIVTNSKSILKLSLHKNCIPQTVIDSISQALKENQSKRPFEYEMNQFQEVYQLYQQKKKALKGQLEKIKSYQQKLHSHRLTEQIELTSALQQQLQKKIAKQQSKIKYYQSNFRLKILDLSSQGQNFLTSPEDKR